MTKDKLFSVTAKDCKFTAFRGSGAGGQHHNKVSTAIRCEHLQSGAVATATESKDQKINKKNAFKRMTETKEFQSWLNLKIEAYKGNLELEENGHTRKMSGEEI